MKSAISGYLASKAKGKSFIQYTAIDQCKGFCYIKTFNEHSTYSSIIFLKYHSNLFVNIHKQTISHNSPINISLKDKVALFEKRLALYGMRHNLIKS